MRKADLDRAPLAWVEVYVARDSVEAAAAAGLLEAEGIETRLRDMGVSLYPVTFGPLGEKRIAVRARDAAQARSLCRRAVEDGFLPEGMVKEERRS